ncbi:MAG: hypothetical protein ACLRW7_20165 [Phocaeicola vulgatus]
MQKMKGGGCNATTAIADGVSSSLGGSKVKRLEAENEGLKQDIANLQKTSTSRTEGTDKNGELIQQRDKQDRPKLPTENCRVQQ